MNFLKKLFGISEDTSVEPIKPVDNEKTLGDLEYELSRRKAQEAREAQRTLLDEKEE